MMDYMSKIRSTINRRVSAKIRYMSPERAAELFSQLIPGTIEQPIIRDLTGGYASQSLNEIVSRKLAIKAGLLAA